MTLQVAVFSILLFGMSGVVLDFGRVYGEHTVMQSYTDQAALAAASELNGLPDAIDRAVDSVFGAGHVTRGGVFGDVDEALQISHLMFMSDLSPDLGSQFDMGADASGDKLIYVAFGDGGGAFGPALQESVAEGLGAADALAEASLQARNVIVVAEERTVRNTLMRLVNVASSPGDGAATKSQRVRTIAAASYKRVICGDFRNLSSLVICDPWSGFSDTDFKDEMSGGDRVGRQFELVASTGSVEPNRLMRLAVPIASREATGFCADPATLPGYRSGMTDAEYELARSICMLSTNSTIAEPRCFRDEEEAEISLVDLSGEAATTALNTAFDMWDDPIAEVVSWTETGAPEEIASPLFQPDIDVLKGVIWNQRLADENEARGLPRSSRLNFAEARAGQSAVANNNVKWNCLHPDSGGQSECVSAPGGGVIDWVSEPASQTEIFTYYAAAAQNAAIEHIFPFVPRTFHEAYGLVRLDGHHISNAGLALALGREVGAAGASFSPQDENGEGTALDPTLNAPNVHPTDAYLTAEDGSLLSASGGVDQLEYTLVFNPDGSQADLLHRDEIFGEDTDGNSVLDTGPDGFQDVTESGDLHGYGYSPIDTDLRRRVFEVTVVDCSALRRSDDDGFSRAPIVGFARMFLLRPPAPTCSGPGLQPWETDGGSTCTNDHISSATIYTEFVTEVSTHDDTYAVLVR